MSDEKEMCRLDFVHAVNIAGAVEASVRDDKYTIKMTDRLFAIAPKGKRALIFVPFANVKSATAKLKEEPEKPAKK